MVGPDGGFCGWRSNCIIIRPRGNTVQIRLRQSVFLSTYAWGEVVAGGGDASEIEIDLPCR